MKKQDNTKTTKDITAEEHLSYQGAVKVSVCKGSKRIRTRRYKNNGGYPLFQFLALSSCGLYSDAEFIRPKYIQLFYVSPSTPGQDPTELEIKAALNSTTGGGAVAKSSRVIYKSTPAPLKNSDNDNPAYSITLEFLIPFAQIISSGTKANAIALYYTGNDSDTSKYCAFANFSSSLLNDATNEYNLFIEWTLTFANKQ